VIFIPESGDGFVTSYNHRPLSEDNDKSSLDVDCENNPVEFIDEAQYSVSLA
jgi:hypothetical protein